MIKYFKTKGTNILFTIMISTIIIGLTGCDKTKADNSTFNQNTYNNQNATMPADDTTELDDTTAMADENTILPEGDIPTSDEDQPIFYGDWIISKVQAAGVGTYSEDDVKVLIGKTLSYSADKASYFGDDISYVEKVTTTPIYTETLYTEGEFVEFYRIPTDLLGLDMDEITVINVTDADGPVSTLILKDIDTILVSGGGTYFELTRSIKE